MNSSSFLWFILIAAMILSMAYSVGGHFLLRPLAIAAVIGFLFFLLVSLVSRFW